jgi:mycoredoxin
MIDSSRSQPRSRRFASSDVPVIVYGTRWCAATQMIRRHLERLGIDYEFADLEADPDAAAQLRWRTGGFASHPTVYVDGEILVEPSPGELDWALTRNGVR